MTINRVGYVISLQARPLAAIGFSAAAWHVACRDRFIGWDDQARRKNLPLVVNNHRFLILPGIKITNLASWILAQVTRRLRDDWQAVYAHDIVLVETFVEKKRFHGTCYRAANWVWVGETVGRGRNDRTSTNWLPIKQVYLYPLDPSFRQRCQTT
ncbi:MAG: Druantia anti-phage system protein DruA [bacterium]